MIETRKKKRLSGMVVRQTLPRTNKNWNNHIKEVSFSGNERKELVVLPYLAGFTENITRIFKAFNVKVCIKPIKTIKNILPTTKDFVDFNQQTGAVYQIPCKNCSGIYEGKSKIIRNCSIAHSCFSFFKIFFCTCCLLCHVITIC